MSKIVIKNAHVISPDVDIENATVTIEDKKIASISTRKNASLHGADEVVDISGQYLMPGFIRAKSIVNLSAMSNIFYQNFRQRSSRRLRCTGRQPW